MDQEFSTFGVYGDLDWFDADKMIYDYDDVQRATARIERMWEERVDNPCEEIVDPELVRKIFRFYPLQIKQICKLLQSDLEPKTKRNNALSVPLKVCTALLYYGSGKPFKKDIFCIVFVSEIVSQKVCDGGDRLLMFWRE